MLWWLVSAADAADCPEGPVGSGQVSARLDEAVLAYAALEQADFERAADEAQRLATCMQAPMEPALASALHRVRGIRLRLLHDDDKASASFAAAARAEPGYLLPQAVAPEGSDLHALWTLAKAKAPSPTQALDLDPGSKSWVDGRADAPRPTVGPYWLQVQGRAFVTTWIAEGPPDASQLPVPGSVAAVPMPAPMPAAPPTDLEVAQERSRNRPLLYTGLASGVVAAGLWGTSAAVRSGYAADPTASKYSLINSTWLASVGTGVLSTALLSTWLVTK